MAFVGASLIKISRFPPHFCFPLAAGGGKSGTQTPGLVMDGQNRGQIPLGASCAAQTPNTKGSRYWNSPQQSIKATFYSGKLELPLRTSR